MPPALQNPHALAILARLTDAGRTVGDHIAPAGATGRYSVLYMIPGPAPDGTLDNPDEDTDLRFQITSVARLAAEARYEADLVHTALLAAAITVTGRSIYRVRKIGGTDSIQRDEDVTPPRFYAVALYGLYSTPA